jgi:2-keto-4-pentenoate hydratase/2-oxohepta-3-ene-1,7-dioic acid hydratase in catechol pathway
LRIANHAGRAVLVVSDGKGADIATASDGRFGPDPQSLYDQWDAFTAWAATAAPVPDVEIDAARLGSPSPAPSQVVAIGLNYADHAAETGFEPPTDLPPVFTKFASSITGPYGEIALPGGGHTDWEVEVVAVIGRTAHRVTADAAWDHVAGLSAGQDLSNGSCSSAARPRSSASPSPTRASRRSAPGSSPSTRSPTATTSRSAARSTARRCRTAARPS